MRAFWMTSKSFPVRGKSLPSLFLEISGLSRTTLPMRSTSRQPMDLHRFWDGVITSSSNLTRLRNEATALRNRQEFHRSQLTELANTDFESWAKKSFEIAAKIAYRNGAPIRRPKGGYMDCTMVGAAPLLPVGYVVNARRIADRRITLTGYRFGVS
jgi:hypothetical protein